MKEIEPEKVVKVVCDICGKTCLDHTDIVGGESIIDGEYAELTVQWGYYSHKDGETHECQMCEECYDKVRGFIEGLGGKIKVTTYL